jgi:hypothetical protein
MEAARAGAAITKAMKRNIRLRAHHPTGKSHLPVKRQLRARELGLI